MLREAVKIIKDDADRISNLSAECEIWEQKANEYIGKAEAYQDVLLSLFSMVLTGKTR